MMDEAKNLLGTWLQFSGLTMLCVILVAVKCRIKGMKVTFPISKSMFELFLMCLFPPIAAGLICFSVNQIFNKNAFKNMNWEEEE